MSAPKNRTVSPTIILWICFIVISSAWYTLDPAAHAPVLPTITDRLGAQIDQPVQAEVSAPEIRTVMH